MKVVAASIVLMVIFAAAIPLQTMARSDCHKEITSLSPCYSYIQESRSTSTPSAQCCSQLENVARAQPECLCEALQGEGFNKTKVLGLPNDCNVQTPAVSLCDSPSASPSGYSTKILNSLLLSGLIAASCALIFMTI